MGQLKLSNSKLNSVLSFICEILVNSVGFCNQRSGFEHQFINQRAAGAVQGLSYLDILKCHSGLLLISWKSVVTDDTGRKPGRFFYFYFALIFSLCLSFICFSLKRHLLLVGEKQKAEILGGILSSTCLDMISCN